MTKTPKTDSQAYDVFYRGDMGGKFTATETKKDPYGDHVSVDFARQLEEENNNMREAIREAYTQIRYAEASFAGLALRLHPNDPSNDAVLARTKAALAKLQPFLQ